MTKLDAKSLMVGDLACWKEDVNNTTPVMITGIIGYEIYVDGVVSTIDSIKPIPLTEKILEKNGFEDWDGWLCFDTDEFSISWCGTILKIHSDNGTCELVSCMYVHQLQHALRLCEIEKEIIV